jgi:hypothetical protein
MTLKELVLMTWLELRLLQKYCWKRNQATFREVGELRLYFMPVVPDKLKLKMLGPEQ